MVQFREAQHKVTGEKIVEIVVDGNVVSTIYPNGEDGIKIISAHFKGVGSADSFKNHVKVVFDEGSDPRLPIPSIEITFAPGPWSIIDGKLVKYNHG